MKLRTLKDLKWRSPKIKEQIDLEILPDKIKPKNDWFICEGNLKKEAIKWVKKDAKDINELKDMTAGDILARWIFRFNITEEDLK